MDVTFPIVSSGISILTAGSYVIKQKLMHLETLISEVSYDIVAFNAQVKSHIADLERRGTTVPNLVNCLMRGYKSAPVLEFVTLINHIIK